MNPKCSYACQHCGILHSKALYIRLKVSSSTPDAIIVAIQTYFIGSNIFSTTTIITRTAADIINAEGVLIFSASLSLAKSNAISIANTPAADIAVAGRSTKKSPQQASVIIGVPIVNNVDIPLNVLCVITGVSGSGKSSLVKGILYPALKRRLDEVAEIPGEYLSMEGDYKKIHHVEFVDQNPIGKSSRSNPATYVKAYDYIRALFAEQPLAKQLGFTPQYFSFNAEGGRCEECKGAGSVVVEMQFMADIVLECDACHGQRFKRDVLDVRYKGKNINDILDMTVSEAISFFDNEDAKKKTSYNRAVIDRLKPLEDVGLGYIKLGQNSSTMSGGENQRVKLAYFISLEKQTPTLFIFDEPTTGLHFHDISKLMKAFNALLERGHSIVVIEHNMEVIKCADWIIDLGPEGGDKGGDIVFAGIPDDIVECQDSLTGKHLRHI